MNMRHVKDILSEKLSFFNNIQHIIDTRHDVYKTYIKRNGVKKKGGGVGGGGGVKIK
jgi:hypothetical protein